jgi:hypothetical protein
MTRINVFKNSTFQVRFFIVFGGLFFIFGIIHLIKALINGFNTNYPAGDWNSVIYTFLGLIFIIMGARDLFVRKYYIEWDDTELRLLLPDTRNPETIILSDITSVNIKLFKIELMIHDKTRIIDLRNLRYKDLRKVKEKLEGIKKDKK